MQKRTHQTEITSGRFRIQYVFRKLLLVLAERSMAWDMEDDGDFLFNFYALKNVVYGCVGDVHCIHKS